MIDAFIHNGQMQQTPNAFLTYELDEVSVEGATSRRDAHSSLNCQILQLLTSETSKAANESPIQNGF